jgi:hypothetical protein
LVVPDSRKGSPSLIAEDEMKEAELITPTMGRKASVEEAIVARRGQRWRPPKKNFKLSDRIRCTGTDLSQPTKAFL